MNVRKGSRRRITTRCSARPRTGRPYQPLVELAPRVLGRFLPARRAPVLATWRMEAMDDFRREAAGGEESRLRGPFGGVVGRSERRSRTAAARCSSLSASCAATRAKRHSMLGQLALDPQVAEARLARVNARLGETLGRQEAMASSQSSSASTWRVAGRHRRSRSPSPPPLPTLVFGARRGMADELAAQLDAALVALRQQLQGARPLTDSLARTQPPPAPRLSPL